MDNLQKLKYKKIKEKLLFLAPEFLEIESFGLYIFNLVILVLTFKK